jgi:hypothetical protein
MEENGVANIPGTQIIYSGFVHPIAGTVQQTIPWDVPDLPPGKYIRAFAARGTDTSEKSVFVTSTFTISC